MTSLLQLLGWLIREFGLRREEYAKVQQAMTLHSSIPREMKVPQSVELEF